MCTSFNDVNVTKNRTVVEQAKTFLLGSFIYCRILNNDSAITEAAAPKNTKKKTKFGLSMFTGRQKKNFSLNLQQNLRKNDPRTTVS